MKNNKETGWGRYKGFTLIEILVVVAIIAILSSVILIGLGPTRQLGRDSRRISDLRQVQNGLELYFNRCGAYPGVVSNGTGCDNSGIATDYPGMSAALIAAGITQNMPADPSTPNRDYEYAQTGGTTYTLGAWLEDANNPAPVGQTPSNGIQCGQPPPSVPGIIYCVSL